MVHSTPLKEIFDRKAEQIELKRLLEIHTFSSMIIYGESGNGKSELIDYILNQNFPTNDILQFDLNDDDIEFSQNPLKNYFDQYYLQNTRLHKFKQKIEGAKLRLSLFGLLSLSPTVNSKFISKEEFEYQKKSVVSQWLKNIYKRHKVLYISNIELISADIDWLILYEIMSNSHERLKIIIEIGLDYSKMEEENRVLYKFIDKFKERAMNIETFDKLNTIEFYRYYYKTDTYPKDIYEASGGVCFNVIHYETAYNKIDGIQLKRKIERLTRDQKYLLLLVHVLNNGDSVSENVLRLLYPKDSLDDFDESLNFLLQEKVLKSNGFEISFRHRKFIQYVREINQAPEVVAVRNNLIKRLKENEIESTIYNVDYIIALQYIGLSRFDDAFDHAYSSMNYFYRLHQYQLVVSIGKIFLDVPHISTDKKYWLFLLYIQSMILIGNGQELISFIPFLDKAAQEKQNYTFQILFIKASILYHTNEFKESNNLLTKNKLSIIEHEEFRPYYFAIMACNFIALGDLLNAKNNFAEAKRCSGIVQNNELELELIRVEPMVIRDQLFFISLEQAVKSGKYQIYKHTLAKCRHNLGLLKIFHTRGLAGREELTEAKNYFAENQCPELTYSAVSYSLLQILDGKYDEAKSDILETIPLCCSEYDKFVVYATLGNIKLLENNAVEAIEEYKLALNVAINGNFKLNDPAMISHAYHNLTLCSLLLGNIEAAKAYIQNVQIPGSAYFREERINRLEGLKKNIVDGNRSMDVRKIPGESENGAWLIKEFECNIHYLFFFDFNAKIILNLDFPALLD